MLQYLGGISFFSLLLWNVDVGDAYAATTNIQAEETAIAIVEDQALAAPHP